MLSAVVITVDWVIKGALMLVFASFVYGLVHELILRFMGNVRRLDGYQLEPVGDDARPQAYSHLEMLLRATNRTYNSSSVSQFIVFSCLIFVLSYVVLLPGLGGEGSNWISLRVAVYAWLLAMLPYCFKRVKLYMIRNENSHALIGATEMLLMKCRSPVQGNDPNPLYRALFEIADELDGPLRKTFEGMVSILQIEGRRSVAKAVALFEYQIQGSWAQQLGVLITKSIRDNRDIERALVKVQQDMQDWQQILEQEKGEYTEVILMGFFPIVLIPVAIFGMNRMLGGSLAQMLFTEPKVFQGLLVCVLSCLAGLVTSWVLSKPRNEV